MKIAICDDEELFCKNIEDALKKIINVNDNIKTMSSGEQLVHEMKAEAFDIVFLDIDMPGISGMQATEKLQEISKGVIIIFVSSYMSFIPNAFRINAFQFLLKPASDEDICYEYFRAVKKHKNDRYIYEINQKSGIVSFSTKEIVYIESMTKHLFLHTNEKTNNNFEYSGKLDDVEKKLVQYDFIRIHQSYLVNMKYIKNVHPEYVTLAIPKSPTLSVSRKLKAKTQESFNLYLSGCRV